MAKIKGTSLERRQGVRLKEIEAYLRDAIESFTGDPPSSEWQRGYLAALLTVRDDLFKTAEQRAAEYRDAHKWNQSVGKH